MENNNLLIMECDGITYGAYFNAEGEIEIYRLTPSGEWEKMED